MNSTILIILLLVVCLVLFKKTKEGFDNIINNGNSNGNSDIKNALINNMENTRNKMKNDYKVFNDETATMANDQYNKFMILSIVTLTALIGTIIYAKM